MANEIMMAFLGGVEVSDKTSISLFKSGESNPVDCPDLISGIAFASMIYFMLFE